MKYYTVIYKHEAPGFSVPLLSMVETETSATLERTLLVQHKVHPSQVLYVFEGHCQLNENWRR